MTEAGTRRDSIVTAARAHADAIRRTLWLREERRRNSLSPGAFKPSRGVDREKPSNYDYEHSATLDGPIYSTEFWRAWRARAVNNCKRTRRRDDVGGADDTGAPIQRVFRDANGVSLSKYGNPTSSFAGGRRGTLIFAAVSGGSAYHGDSLLREYHEAAIQPLSERGNPSFGCSTSRSKGVRLSHNEPRPTIVHGKCSAGDGVYDIALADKVVCRAAPSWSFRASAAISSEIAIQGISRDTPGAKYDLKVGGSSAPAPATLFSSADRFPVQTAAYGAPGPGQYEAGGNNSEFRAVAWAGVETFMDSGRCRPALPCLRPWQGFGNGCSVQEHIDYGGCLDGRCCSRHPIERKNALLVVQFLGEQGRGRVGQVGGVGHGQRRSRQISSGRGSRRRRRRRLCGRHDGDGGRSLGRLEGCRQKGLTTHTANSGGSHSPALPLSEVHQALRSISPVEDRINVGGKADDSECGLSRRKIASGSSVLALQSPRPLFEDRSVGTCSTKDVSAPGTASGSAAVGEVGAAIGASPGKARATGGKRTPLHFASERGELALVDRLCNQGDDRNAVDERGYTPLHDAADRGHTRVVDRLLQGDEKNTASPAGGKTRARRAASERSHQVPANPNVQDNNGRTPLYLACLRSYERIVRTLLKAGACPDLLDKRGKSAQEVAGAQRIYQLLQYKADVSLVKVNIAAQEERKRTTERHRQEAEQVEALRELAVLKKEELRLRAAIDALKAKRAAYAAAARQGIQ